MMMMVVPPQQQQQQQPVPQPMLVPMVALSGASMQGLFMPQGSMLQQPGMIMPQFPQFPQHAQQPQVVLQPAPPDAPILLGAPVSHRGSEKEQIVHEVVRRGRMDSLCSTCCSVTDDEAATPAGARAGAKGGDRPTPLLPVAQDVAHVLESLKQCFSLQNLSDKQQKKQKMLELGEECLELAWPDVAIDVRGRGRVIDHLTSYKDHIPDLTLTVQSIKAPDDKHVHVEFTAKGTQIGNILPHFPVGRTITWNCHSVFELTEGNRIKSHRIFFFFEAKMVRDIPIVEALAQSSLSLALTSGGSRIMQTAVEASSGDHHDLLVARLRGHVWEAAGSPHANHVLQKIIAVMAPARIRFVVEELRGRAVQAAKHRIRCRVLERLIEYFAPEDTADLVDELLEEGLLLCRHAFANFIVQRVLEHGTYLQRHRMAAIVASDAVKMSRHKIASNVVRCTLINASPADRQAVVDVLLADARQAEELEHHIIGSFVMREVKHQRKNQAHNTKEHVTEHASV